MVYVHSSVHFKSIYQVPAYWDAEDIAETHRQNENLEMRMHGHAGCPTATPRLYTAQGGCECSSAQNRKFT